MNNNWTELIFVVATRDVRQAESLLASCVETGVYVEDYSDIEMMLPIVGAADYVDEKLTAKNRETAAIHLYISAKGSAEHALSKATALLEGAGINFELRSSILPEADWANDWKKLHKPHRVGKRILLCPTWESCTPGPSDVLINIDPGGAFGSGEDITTILCLQMLQRQLERGDKVLDMGCGSGVLSVAALLLGASNALGVDIDRRVLKEAPATAEQNGVGGRFKVLCGNVLSDARFAEEIGGDYDLICGNMTADLQLLMAPLYAQKLKPVGILVLSGVLSTRADEVNAAMQTEGLKPFSTISEGDWVSIALRK